MKQADVVVVKLKCYDARLLTTSRAPSTGWIVETWVIHERNDPGASIAQIGLFQHKGNWFAWTGNISRNSIRAIAKELADRRNDETS